jgi:uncharacterized membrane protein YhaH (DUF805 family)
MQTASTSFAQLYFSASGRISRSTFWLRFYVPAMVITMLAAMADIGLGTFNKEFSVGLVGGVVGILLLYPCIIAYVKRSHDRNRSGWFVLLLLVPLVNFWPAVELLFLKGTDGPNRFGQDPVGSGAGSVDERAVRE